MQVMYLKVGDRQSLESYKCVGMVFDYGLSQDESILCLTVQMAVEDIFLVELVASRFDQGKTKVLDNKDTFCKVLANVASKNESIVSGLFEDDMFRIEVWFQFYG